MDIKNSKAAQTTKTYNRNEIESQTEHRLGVIGDTLCQRIEHHGHHGNQTQQDAQRLHLQKDSQSESQQQSEKNRCLPHRHCARGQRAPPRSLYLPVQIAVPHVIDDTARAAHDERTEKQQQHDPRYPTEAHVRVA